MILKIMHSMREGETATGFAHAGVTVSDMERSLRFYGDGLGLVCMNRRRVTDAFIKRIVAVGELDAIEVAYLALPDGTVAVELLRYDGADACEGRARPCDPGSGHVCLLVGDAHAVWERALAAGGTARSEAPVRIADGPYAGGFSGYLADPDGYPVELLQPPSPDARPGAGR